MVEVGEDHGLRVAGEDHDGAMAGRGHGDVDRPWADPRYLESVCTSLDGRRLKSASAGGEPDIVRIEPGLSDLEVAAAQQRFGLSFPPDLRALLQHGLPTGRDLPNWRDPDADDYLRWALGKPGRAIEFDVLNNGVWFGRWGPRPETDARSAALAADELRKVPVLVPVYANHYLPGDPPAAGNPVLSFWQIIDAVHRANDLADYLAAEFDAPRPAWTTPTDRRRTVPFWSAVIESSGSLHELADV